MLDGFNEVALGNANRVAGANPLYPSLGHWKHLLSGPAESDATLDLLIGMRQAKQRMGSALAASLRWRLYYSAAATFVVDSIVDRSRARYVGLAEQIAQTDAGEELSLAFRGPPLPDDFESGLEEIVDIWVESSISLNGMCRARGIPFITSCSPPSTTGAPSRPPGRARQHRDPAGMAGGRGPRLPAPARGERLLAAGVPFFDASLLFEDVDKTLYYDCCHVVASGSRILGRYCANRALEVMPAELPAAPPSTAER